MPAEPRVVNHGTMRYALPFALFLTALMALPAGESPRVWDLTPPPGVKTDNDFLLNLVNHLRTAPHDSVKLEDAVRDLTHMDNRKHGVPTLCAAMAKPDFTLLYGPSQVALVLFKEGQRTLALRMLPFLMTVSERTSEAEGLSAFVFVLPNYRDLRVVPRLIQLIEHPNKTVRDDAANALAQLTLVPVDKITPNEMRSWQSRNQGKSLARIWHDNLTNKDPRIALAAVTQAIGERDPDIVPALCQILRGTDRRLLDPARDQLERVLGTDWGCKPDLSPAERAKAIAKLEKWWATEKGRFQWLSDTSADAPKDEGLATADDQVAAAAADPNRALVERLGSMDGLQSEQAESKLLEQGKESVPSLIIGLAHPSMMVRRKCDKLLKTISQQDMGYDPRADAVALAAAIAKWQAWAEADKKASTTPAPAPTPAPVKKKK